MFAELGIITFLFLLDLILYYININNKDFLIFMVFIFSFVINVASLGSEIPFTPFLQLFYILVEIYILIIIRSD